ncbi:winged helix-turn-helix domain-containing protein [Anoxybacteroides amylolyticum]|uniref:Winged helix-turn helix family protein n=1 Tax=Anoxybacteroides amylolyticum TaxID=294699 RepID=A0A160F4Y8_9BACL|nr:winged helix-turn-helix domain-containing protein [Anoxybacillus amylolyticus]ANB60865.1 winged helix-turn helix family protein [Anoxybacillus amylolyticus]
MPLGRSPFLAEEQQQELRQVVLTTTPVDVGWGNSSSWNTRILQSYIQQTYGVSMSREGIRKLLHRLRLSWTRPTYKLVKGDPERQAAFQKELEFIKKTNHRERHHVLCGRDTCSCLSSASYDMGRSRHQKQVPSYGHHAHVSIFGAADVQQGDVVFQHHQSMLRRS